MFGRRKKKKKIGQSLRKTSEIPRVLENEEMEIPDKNEDWENSQSQSDGKSIDISALNLQEDSKEKTYDTDVMNMFSKETMIEDGFEESYEIEKAKKEKTSHRIGRNQKNKRKKRIIWLIVFIAVIIGVGIYIMRLPYFRIKEIAVNGNKNISKETILKESGLKTGKNIFFINKSQIKSKMKKNPYYKEVDIDRKLPSKISINVTERGEKVVLPYGEKYVVLDGEGVVLRLSKTRPKVTEIKNAIIKNMEKGVAVEVKDADLFQKSLEVVTTSEKSDLFFNSVLITKDEIECNVYGTLFVRGNYEQFMKNIKNGNLKNVLLDVYKKNIKRGTVNITVDGAISFTPTFS